MTEKPRAKPKVALVIGSGSVKCAASLGLLKVLERENIFIDMVVGCSGGSIYAAAIALGWSAQKTTETTIQLWTRDVTSKRNPRAMLQILFPRLFGFDETFGLVDDRKLNQRIIDGFGTATFQDTRIPLFLIATNFHNGDQVVMNEGKISDAVRASISIPYIFPAYKVGDHYLLDGYLSDPLPVGIAIKEGADVIIALGFESSYQSSVSSLIRYNFQFSSITSNNLLRSNFAFHNLAHHSEIIPVIPEFTQQIRLFDTEKIPYIIEEGERAAKQQLPYLRSLLFQHKAESEDQVSKP